MNNKKREIVNKTQTKEKRKKAEAQNLEIK